MAHCYGPSSGFDHLISEEEEKRSSGSASKGSKSGSAPLFTSCNFCQVLALQLPSPTPSGKTPMATVVWATSWSLYSLD